VALMKKIQDINRIELSVSNERTEPLQLRAVATQSINLDKKDEEKSLLALQMKHLDTRKYAVKDIANLPAAILVTTFNIQKRDYKSRST
jgi:hypothetical protein